MKAGDMRRRAASLYGGLDRDRERAETMSDADYRQYIVDKFEGRWGIPGYRKAIQGLAVLCEEARIDEDERETYYSECERIAEEYHQGLNTVVADSNRLRLQQREGRRRTTRTAFTSIFSDEEREAIRVIAEAAKERIRRNLEPDAPYDSEDWGYRRLQQEVVRLPRIEIAALTSVVPSGSRSSNMEDVAFDMASRMCDLPGYGIGMEKPLF